MNKLRTFVLWALLCLCTYSYAGTKPVVINSPQGYQVMGISPNGKWACGIYIDISESLYAFRWNLESGNIELLSTSMSIGWQVANDGTVSGTFSDPSVNANTTIEMPGYYREGKWNSVEIPSGATVDEGAGYGITPDGHYISGELLINGKYIPYIWHDGKISRQLSDNTAFPYTISPDGKAAAGWEYGPIKKNRISTYWPEKGSAIHLNSTEDAFARAQKFSPDGKKILFWGGWNANAEVACIYDIDTEVITALPTLQENASMDLFDISNNTTIVGNESNRGYIYVNGQGHYADEYLESLGVDFSGLEIPTDANGTKQIANAAAISADGNVISLWYYDAEYSLHSIIVFLNHETSGIAPAEVKAAQVEGINAVRLTWSAPLGAEGITGYNIYRNGTKINETLITSTAYYDKNLLIGNYEYTISAVYGDGNETKSEPAMTTVSEKTVSMPQTVFARQKGINGAHIQWKTPATNLIGKSFYNIATAEINGFGADIDGFEVAICYDKEEVECYQGCKLTEVAFYPMSEQAGWTINIYTRDANGALQLIGTQPVSQTLVYKERNTVKLETPVAMPDGDLIIAVAVNINNGGNDIIGADPSQFVAGHSDLLRQITESDFYSLYERAISKGAPAAFTAWMIDAVLAPEGASETADDIDHYDVYDGDKKIGETKNKYYTVNGLEDGMHNFGVSAVYSDNRNSDKATAGISIAENYPAVDKVTVTTNGSSMTAEWAAPADNDQTVISYANGTAQTQAPKGTKSNNYGLMAATDFYPAKLKGYNGYQIKSLRFYPIADAVFTFFIEENGKQITEHEVANYTLNTWNTVELPTPITINENSNYRLILDCYDVEAEKSPLAIDNTLPKMLYSDLYSLDGSSWNPFSSDTGLRGNWMLGMTIASATGTSLNITGYDVRIDGVKVNTEKLTATEVQHIFNDNESGQHSINVDVYYQAKAESVKGNSTYFNITPTGISSNTIAEINIRYGENFITVDGGNAKSITVYSTDGATAASAQGGSLNVSGLNTGIYVVKANVDGNVITRKISIVK